MGEQTYCKHTGFGRYEVRKWCGSGMEQYFLLISTGSFGKVIMYFKALFQFIAGSSRRG